jgi:TonB family protein
MWRRNVKTAVVSLVIVIGVTTSFAASPSVNVGEIPHAIKSPYPTYPYDARARGITGSGVFLLRIEIKTGQVTRVTIAKSTGNAMLDDAAVSALKNWTFEPNKLRPIRELLPGVNDSRRDEDSLAKVPVSFVLGSRPTRRTLP